MYRGFFIHTFTLFDHINIKICGFYYNIILKTQTTDTLYIHNQTTLLQSALWANSLNKECRLHE